MTSCEIQQQRRWRVWGCACLFAPPARLGVHMTLLGGVLSRDGQCSFGCRVTTKHVWENASMCCYLVVIAKGCWFKDIFVSTTDIFPMTIFMFTVADGVCSLGCSVTSKHVWDNASTCCYLAVIKNMLFQGYLCFVSTTGNLPMTIFIFKVAGGVCSFGCRGTSGWVSKKRPTALWLGAGGGAPGGRGGG